MSEKSSTNFMILSILCVSLVSFVIFLPTFDEPLFPENHLEIWEETVNGFEVSQVFKTGFRGNQFKPLTRLFMYAQYKLFGFDAFGYRVVFFLLYVFNGLLVVILTKMVTGKNYVALLSGLLFVVHFSHWEIAVHTNVTHHYLVVFFYMATLSLFVKYLLNDKKIWLAASFLSATFCMLSSQTWISLLFAMMGLEYMIRDIKLRGMFRVKNAAKYIPFLLLMIFHVTYSLYLQIGKNTYHDPFVESNLFTFYAPLWSNFVTYMLELFIPIVGSNIPEYLVWISMAGILALFGGIIIKGSKVMKFYLFWIIISQFIFLFWVWDYPMGRYTYMSSIPFSVLIMLLVFAGYDLVKANKTAGPIYIAAATAGIGFFILINAVAYNISFKTNAFHLAGRNHVSFLNAFQKTLPEIPDESIIYISGMPDHDFYKYGQWTNEEMIGNILTLYYDSDFEIRFIKEEELSRSMQSATSRKKEIYLKLINMNFQRI